MWGEYGYMEEGKLGKPYNLKLLKRLARYALPYKKTIFIAFCMTIVITFSGLAIPYLTKIAIDKYILSSWYLVDLDKTDKEESITFFGRYGHLLEKTGSSGLFLIHNWFLKDIDPSDLETYKTKEIISRKRFYKSSFSFLQSISGSENFVRNIKGSILLTDGKIALPMDYVNRLPVQTLLEIREKDVGGVAFIGCSIILILIIVFGAGYGESYLLELTGQKIILDIRLTLFRHLQNQSLSFFDRHPVGKLLTRVTNDVENLNEMFKSFLVTLFKDLLFLLGIVIVLLYLNWRLALFCFILMPFIFGLTILFSSIARDAFRALREAVSKINSFLQERITGMRLIQLYAREAAQMKDFAGINHQNYLAGMKQIRVFAVFMPIMELFSSVAVALLIWHGGGKVIGDQLSLGSLVAFISYMRMFFKPIRDIAEKYNIMQSAMASIERIVEFLDHHEEISEPDSPLTPSSIQGAVDFDNISFSYQEGKPVLDEVSFKVNPGEIVAIVGATGAGKTTIVNLLERFYDNNNGHILLDNKGIDQYSIKDLHSHLGFVMQDVFIFSGSIRDNILLGKKDIHMNAINSAIQQANADKFIERLPKGLDQELGEGGANLSAGERQLLSFARALAHNPRVLILDEATSSVDPETERLIQDAISKMTSARTTLVIAHRLSTIRNADSILVMHKGKIREQGNHEELMALKGVYYRLNMLRGAEN